MNFNTDMSAAPRDEVLVLAIPSGDAEEPVSLFTGSWDDEEGRWYGAWCELEDLADFDPVGWAATPEVSEEIERAALSACAPIGSEPAAAG